jgi:DNA uptake protein ComE-like DNA-binding protein
MKISSFVRFVRRSLAAGLALAVGLTTIALAQDDFSDMAAQNAQASRLDPEDYKYMQPICTRCHTPAMFLHSRTWSEWQDIFNQMSSYGAEATQEQWDHVRRYVQHSLTQIDVNHAGEDELSAVLGVDEKTAIAIVQRRADRKFESAEDVEAVPGVDKAAIEAMKPRLLFDRLSEDK